MVHATKQNKGQFFCYQCNKWINADGYYYTHGTKRDSMCKECRKEYRKDAKKIHSKEYYSEHREHYLELHRKWREDNLEKKLWYGCRSRAKQKGIEFDIEPEDIVIPEVCPVLGIPLDTNAETGMGKGYRIKANPYRPSVDRIDNTKGYVKGNIEVISWRANTLKSDATFEEVVLLYEHMLTQQ